MSQTSTQAHEGARTLVVLLHAYSHRASSLGSVEKVVHRAWPKAHIYRPELPAALFSTASPNRIVVGLLEAIDTKYLEAESRQLPYENIVLVGHSLGALLARKLYVAACGEVLRAPLEPEFRGNTAGVDRQAIPPRPWAAKVSRIVLLAGMNRGWRISHHLSLKNAPLWTFGAALGHMIHLVTRRWLLIFTIRRGAEFVTQLRIQWLLMRRRANSSQRLGDADRTVWPGKALTIQLLGSRDDMVAPEDNIDLLSGGDFIYLDVPYSGHANVIDMDDPAFGAGRARVFSLALTGTIEDLQREAVIPSDERFASADEKVKSVVFVIHGIRDVGYWTHKIARRIQQRAGGSLGEWATETSSYGYFPMLPFLFPWYRRQKVEWLMDQYAEALARYPNASFSYVGHSNGTYLLAKALELYPSCAFENVVFAGSVVRCAYDWQRFASANPPRIKAVLNFVATSDWVVAFFPRFFELFGLQDLGSAGHDGFVVTRPIPPMYQVRYIKGGHGAGIAEPVWDVIADFVVSGKVAISEVHPVRRRRNPWIQLVGRFPPLVWITAALVAWVVWRGIAWSISAIVTEPSSQGFAMGLALATYVLLLWMVLTRL